MDASASKKKYADVDNLYDIYLKIQNLTYPSNALKRKSVTKYARLPDVDINTKESWHQKSYLTQPRFRRIVTIDNPKLEPLHSLRSEIAVPQVKMTSDFGKRKVIKIGEERFSFHPTSTTRKAFSNLISRAIETDKNDIQQIETKVSVSATSKSPKESKSKLIRTKIANKKENEVGETKFSNKNKYIKNGDFQDGRNKSYNEYPASTRSSKSAISSQKVSLSKKIVTRQNVKEVNDTKNKFSDNIYKLPPKRKISSDKTKLPKSQNLPKFDKNKPVTIICVPIDENSQRGVSTQLSENVLKENIEKVNSCVQVLYPSVKDSCVGTAVSSQDQIIEVGEELINEINCKDNDIEPSNDVEKKFDTLNIPNVKLTNNKIDILKEKDVLEKNKSNENTQVNETKVERCQKSASCIITRATLTYTTKQKIDFHVVGSDDVLETHLTSRKFPLNVVSVFKKEVQNDERKCNDLNNKRKKSQNDLKDPNLNSSCVSDDYKLVKPSEIISTIKINTTLLQSDYINEQFQRELNFIDSFFESLQYLENCSLSEKSIHEKKVEDWINISGNELKNLEFGSFLSNFENDVCFEDSKTMASQSLCLLNLLIRDEQRRAKNLLFVLKMREDALKDFTKSQILWLENKKRQDNTDISTLKKKQRGALLKLQHECGEMQRMRKALLTLSEKRKLAFIKTKKNIELKLRNSVNVEQIILGKKKLKRSTSSDRPIAPLKCFELSSSGCDDSTTSRPKSNTQIALHDMQRNVTSSEKFVQTSDNAQEISHTDQSTDTSDDNFVIVDGSYLNILFHSLYTQNKSDIFSSGKQYEVNKEALKNIVQTSNMQHNNFMDTDIKELVDKMKNLEVNVSSTPSTARSLVEEFDQIYKNLAEEDKSNDSSNNKANDDIQDVIQTNDDCECDSKLVESDENDHILNRTSDEACTCEPIMVSVGTDPLKVQEASQSVAGPLPVPPGEPAVTDDVPSEVSNWLSQKSSMASLQSSLVYSSSSSNQTVAPSLSSFTTPAQYEAEELRRQQLAIEREIKALEQQQCQLLAVREIPDKPPPPYTPPFEPRPPKQPRMFIVDEVTDDRIEKIITQPNNKMWYSDPFDMFMDDFCKESLEKRRRDEKSEKYWDTCNYLPMRPDNDQNTIVKKTANELREVLTSVPPTIVSGVGARRSDHIDDILFAEWRRCEPEWTSLHVDEVIVKNQVFESIFQKILTETVDEYKKTVIATDEN